MQTQCTRFASRLLQPRKIANWAWPIIRRSDVMPSTVIILHYWGRSIEILLTLPKLSCIYFIPTKPRPHPFVVISQMRCVAHVYAFAGNTEHGWSGKECVLHERGCCTRDRINRGVVEGFRPSFQHYSSLVTGLLCKRDGGHVSGGEDSSLTTSE